MIYFKKLDNDINKSINKRGLQARGKAQRYVDNEVIKRMDKYTPFDVGTLKNSPVAQSSIGTGLIVQQTPYAKRWYYEPANFQGAPTRGNKWFERMKASHKSDILRGVSMITGGKAK